MTADDDTSDLTSLSSLSPVPSEDELDEADAPAPAQAKPGLLKFFPKLKQTPNDLSPPPRKRSPSPPHEYILADNPNIAFIVMFRNRFSDAFPKSLAHFGPQELERDVADSTPGARVEHFICALLGLLLNRKQDVKQGHYGRALEDAIASHKNQWPVAWEDKSPLSGGATFNSMTPTERLTLLRTLVLWSMASSEIVKGLINQSYKQNRLEDDLNQPKAVQPWGSDGDKRRYFLIEGQDDTHFRVYRESNPAGANRTWWSVAGSVEELKSLAEKLEVRDGGPKARNLSQKITLAIPRFETGDEKRKRREYRQMRKEQFKSIEPGFSLYEGRTRGKRMKYTFSEEEDDYSDSTGNRQSARNTGANTPAETVPVTTSSGRQVRAPRLNMMAGANAPVGIQVDGSENNKDSSVRPWGRPRRSTTVKHSANGWNGNGLLRNSSISTEDKESEADFGDENDADAQISDGFEDEDEDDFDDDGNLTGVELADKLQSLVPQSLVVKLSVTSPKLRRILTPGGQFAHSAETPGLEVRKTNEVEQGETSLSEIPALDSIMVIDGPSETVVASSNKTVDDVSRASDAALSDRGCSGQVTASVGTAAPSTLRGSPE